MIAAAAAGLNGFVAGSAWFGRQHDLPNSCASPSATSYFFFFNDTATTEIYTLSLHDALPICGRAVPPGPAAARGGRYGAQPLDRKSTRLNSSHHSISYAVFCLKKKKIDQSSEYHFSDNMQINTITI